VVARGIKPYYRRSVLLTESHDRIHPGPTTENSSAASASGRSVSPAGWCCLPIWSAISSTTRSAIFRWMRLPSASIITSCSGRFPPVGMVFYAAVLIHAGLGIWALYQRRQFHWKAIEPLQLVLGLSIPALIIAHLAGVRLGQRAVRTRKALSAGVLRVLGGCVAVQNVDDVRPAGHRLDPRLHRTLFLAADESVLQTRCAISCSPARCWFRRWRCSVSIRADEPSFATAPAPNGGRHNLSQRQVGTPAEQAILERHHGLFPDRLSRPDRIGPAGAGRARPQRTPRRHDHAVLRQWQDHTGAERPQRARGEPALHRVPHASVCGGRARCSTCRIRVIGDCASLPEPSQRESFVLDRVGTDSDPSIRLACQLQAGG
jgi:adenylate cyclase